MMLIMCMITVRYAVNGRDVVESATAAPSTRPAAGPDCSAGRVAVRGRSAMSNKVI